MKLLLALLISSIGVANGEEYKRMRDELSSKISNMIDTRLSETLYAQNGIERGYQVEVQKPIQQVKNTVQQKVEVKKYQPYKSQYLSKQQNTPLYNSYSYLAPVSQTTTSTTTTPVTQTFSRNWEPIQPVKTTLVSTQYYIPKNTESNVNIIKKQIIPQTQTTNKGYEGPSVLSNTNNDEKLSKKSSPVTTLTFSSNVTQYQKQVQQKKQRQQQQSVKKQQQSISQRTQIPQVIQLQQQPKVVSSPSANVIVGSFKDTNHVQGKGNIIGSRSNSLAKGDLLDMGFENMLEKDFDKKFGL